MSSIKYHITPRKNLVSILTNGLKVDQRYCMASSDHYKHFKKAYQVKPIFLTDDPGRLVKEQLTSRWIKEKNPVILSVNVDGLSLIPEYDCVDWMPEPIPPDYTWISIENILPWRLKLTSKKCVK